MNMTEGEICRQYRSAKDRASQLQILADLNCAPRLEIIKILMHNGEQVRLPLAAKGKKRTTELTDEELLDFLCSIETYEQGSVKTIEGGVAMCSVTEVEQWLKAESEG